MVNRKTILKQILAKRGGSKEATELTTRKSYPDGYGLDATSIINKMSFDKSNVEVLGSMGVRSQAYASDFDCFEVVKTDNVEHLALQFQNIVANLINTRNTYITDIKCGSVDEWKVVDDKARVDKNGNVHDYDPELIKSKLNELYKFGVISKEELTRSFSLIKDKPNAVELFQIMKLTRFNVVRWNANEILNGYKKLRDGTVLSLADALMGKSLFKLDCISLGADGLYNEFSIIYDIRLNGRRVNKQPVEVEQSMINDIIYYSSVGNWFKTLKRVFSLAQYRYRFKKGYKKIAGELIESLTKILNSDLGLLYQTLGEMDLLVLMLEDNIPVKRNVLLDHINSFIERIGKIYSVSGIVKHNKKLFNELISLLNLEGSHLAERIDDIHDKLKKLLNKETRERMDEVKLDSLIAKML